MVPGKRPAVAMMARWVEGGNGDGGGVAVGHHQHYDNTDSTTEIILYKYNPPYIKYSHRSTGPGDAY